MNYPRKNPIFLKQIYTFHSNKVKNKTQKSEIFSTFEKIHRYFISILKSEETKNHISNILVILISKTTNLLQLYCFNIAFYETLEKIKKSL